jgi:O-acetyl-ADP-ribose deacetylase (regulator of RNase III)
MDSNRITQTVIQGCMLELVQGDITREETDAIVNAANASLLGGGGVDGAIHRAAGPQLLAETRTLGGCETGGARITRGYNLKARHVIHAVGPIYQRGSALVADQLASAYRRSLELAVEHGLESLAFPAISTGIYGYPLAEAAPIALQTVIDFLESDARGDLKRVRFVLFSEPILDQFALALGRLLANKTPPTSDVRGAVSPVPGHPPAD